MIRILERYFIFDATYTNKIEGFMKRDSNIR